MAFVFNFFGLNITVITCYYTEKFFISIWLLLSEESPQGTGTTFEPRTYLAAWQASNHLATPHSCSFSSCIPYFHCNVDLLFFCTNGSSKLRSFVANYFLASSSFFLSFLALTSTILFQALDLVYCPN
jgi:hypothetical protein